MALRFPLTYPPQISYLLIIVLFQQKLYKIKIIYEIIYLYKIKSQNKNSGFLLIIQVFQLS